MKTFLLIVTALLITSGVNAEKLITIKEINLGMSYDQIVSQLKNMNYKKISIIGENGLERYAPAAENNKTTYTNDERSNWTNDIVLFGSTEKVVQIQFMCGVTKTCEMSTNEIAMALTKSKLLLFEGNDFQQCSEGYYGDEICVDIFPIITLNGLNLNLEKKKSSPEF